ncbi:SIMPL domain-containing protein [Chitinimonas sp. BJYL2]|uniref:SIMPL domain-containing protein n=1 Tax=Chitinimonas sp. BJYL2 TaxID=2976696 RepID=UPI0022B3A8D2|nr:SIMPL domain-containing protein [Chitinimonas sp. BJYL2]
MRVALPYAALLMLAGLGQAAEQPHYNVVNLQAEVRRAVPNDLAQASLYVEFSDPSAAVLADKLNRAAADALRIAKAYGAVKVSMGGNHVYPLYNSKNKAEGWRGRAEVRVESKDFKVLAELIGKLQTQMQLGGMSFSVAADTREKMETALMGEAINAFRARADAAQRSLGGKGYKLVNISINTSGSYPQPVQRAPMLMAKSMVAEMAPPPMEGGESEVVVGVAGSVQID